MFVLFGLMCIAILLSLKIQWKGLDKQYLSKENTQAVKGIFILFVFMSHIKGYIDVTFWGDQMVVRLLVYLGQLMVAFFLFSSGYGVYESIKSKGETYVRNMPKNRIGKTFFDFSLAIFLFLFLGILLGNQYSFSTTLLSFTGWTSVGNSNWYMFAIFTLYLITVLSFRVFCHSNGWAIVSVTVLSCLYIYVMSDIKEYWWSDTYLCYAAGMWFSFGKDKLDDALERMKTKGWFVALLGMFVCYFVISPYRNDRLLFHNFTSICFCLIGVFILMKISIKSKLLMWFGTNLFWIYILQRIPMILFQFLNLGTMNQYFYFSACLLATVGLALVMKRCSAYLMEKTWWLNVSR